MLSLLFAALSHIYIACIYMPYAKQDATLPTDNQPY